MRNLQHITEPQQSKGGTKFFPVKKGFKKKKRKGESKLFLFCRTSQEFSRPSPATQPHTCPPAPPPLLLESLLGEATLLL